MPDRDLRLLIIDDSPEDRTVVRFMLEEIPARSWQFLEEEKGASALERLQREEVDCILLDYHLPDMNAARFLRELTERFGALRFPVVVFTGAGRSSLSQQALLAGAQDYLSKGMIRADTLVRAIDNAVKQVHLLREQEKHREKLEAVTHRLRLFETALRETSAPVLITDAELAAPGPRIVFVNSAFTALTGYGEAEIIGQRSTILHGAKTSRIALARMRRDLIRRRPFRGQVVQYRKNGSEFTVNLSVTPVEDEEGRPTYFVASRHDATEGGSLRSEKTEKRAGKRGLLEKGTLYLSPLLYRRAAG